EVRLGAHGVEEGSLVAVEAVRVGGVQACRCVPAEASVTGTTTNGLLRIAEVARGNVQLETSNGSIEVGIREGAAAWLDVSSNRGQVRNALPASEAPEQAEDTVKLHARTNWGNIDIRRATA
ncbi:hypothetical protein ABZW95_29665, partial [Streptomyces sp. NPDC004579]